MACDVRPYRIHARHRRSAARVLSHEEAGVAGASLHPIDPRDVLLGNDAHIIVGNFKRAGVSPAGYLGPAAMAHEICDAFDVDIRIALGLAPSVKEVANPDLPGRVSRLEERHGAHVEEAEPPRPGVHRVLPRRRRPREQVEPRFPGTVHRKAHGVPELRRVLPLVQQPRELAPEQQRGLFCRQPEVVRARVGVLQEKRALCPLKGGRGLPAPLWAAYADRASMGQLVLQQRIRDSRQVFHSMPPHAHSSRYFTIYSIVTLPFLASLFYQIMYSWFTKLS